MLRYVTLFIQGYIVTVRGLGNEAKSGIALFDGQGNFLWKKEELGWRVIGPLDPIRSHENGERRGYLMLSPQKTFFVSSLRDGVSCYTLDGKRLWLNPRTATILNADVDWKYVVLWETRSRSVVVIDPATGKEIFSFTTSCDGGPYYGDEALQIRDGLILIKTGMDRRFELSRCFAVSDAQGKQIWKKSIKRNKKIRPMEDGGEDIALLQNKKILEKKGSKRELCQIVEP